MNVRHPEVDDLVFELARGTQSEGIKKIVVLIAGGMHAKEK